MLGVLVQAKENQFMQSVLFLLLLEDTSMFNNTFSWLFEALWFRDITISSPIVDSKVGG